MEADLYTNCENHLSKKKWILGCIIGGIAVVTVTIVVLFATGILGDNKKSEQSNTGMQPNTEISKSETQSEESVVTPTMASSPTLKPTESPVGNVGGMEDDVSGNYDNTGDLTNARTPEETYKQYIETFVESVNTGDTGGLSQVLSGKVYKQQCDLVQNYYKRGIREELQSYSVTSIKRVNDNRTKVNAKETIEVLYEDGSSKVVKQKYSYVCDYINSVSGYHSHKCIKRAGQGGYFLHMTS